MIALSCIRDMWLHSFNARAVVTLVTYTTLFPEVNCAKILGAFNNNCKSHFMVFEALMKGLAARGHQVHVLSHFPQKETVPNYIDIDVSGTVPSVMDNITIDTALSWSTVPMMDFIWKFTKQLCHAALDHPNGQALLNSTESYDVVIAEIFGCECALGFAWKFKAPLVNIISSVALPWTHERFGNPDHPAYTPSYFLPYTHRMDFWQRLTNFVYNVALNIGNKVYSFNPANLVVQSYFGKDTPSIDKLVKNSSLVLVNSHYSINWPRPTVPAFVEVGGMHIPEPKTLPQALLKFFDESVHGVVYFNLGTLVKVQTFPPKKLKALLDAFGALPERVLMKYTGDYLPGKPDNVMTSKWIPQLDVLSHHKTKLFISHGGLGGTHETVYAGVPVVGIPLFADQEPNINNLQELGMAVKLHYEDVTKESLLKAIRTVTDDHRYSENAKRVSALFKDRPMAPLDTAVYWVEYVIRHRGAPHLRSAGADLPLYQYLLLDVIAVLLVAATGSLLVMYSVAKFALGALIRRKSTAPKRKIKRQ